jgi:NADPH:quinone reductase-like Zn-dependent oxidoreductase
MGLMISAVSSGSNEELVRSLGADTFLDYTSAGFWNKTTQYDIVFDAVGKLSKTQLSNLTRKDGKTLTVGSLDVAKETKQQLEQLKEWFDSGKLKAVIDKTYSLDEIQEAHAYAEKGHKVGSVVIKIN